MSLRRTLKRLAAGGADLAGLTRLLHGLTIRARNGAFVRIVNYHDTPARAAAGLRRQLRFYSRHYCGVTSADLAALVATGRWEKPKPGLLISFDDGLRSHYDVAAPLLDEFGFHGWFFVPTDFIDCAPDQQAAFARAHAIACHPRARADDLRLAMSWDELRALDGRHVIGCHTRTHCRLSTDVAAPRLRSEIVDAKRLLEARLGHEVESFCWVGGEEHTYTAAAAACIREAGYRYAFATCAYPVLPHANPFQLHRTNIEADWSLPLVRFQLCGFPDLAHAGKRARVNRILDGRP